MNWLAHAFLSCPDTDFRLGNLLADLVKGSDLDGMPPRFLSGVQCHRAIDAFTDSHPVPRRSRMRIRSDWGRFSGILVDVFYDHFLAVNWHRYTDVPLAAFTASVYGELACRSAALPEHARRAARIMTAEDHLGTYARIEGVEAVLRRISHRLSVRTNRAIALEGAAASLKTHYEGIGEDFAVFFPEVRKHARGYYLNAANPAAASPAI
jgi:acyl carrier protein phosphodiesterase